jgi:aspartate/methionine/tyrosine aminotransferase
MGAPDFPTPLHIVEAGCEASHQGFTKYTPALGFDDLKSAITEKLERDNALKVDPATEVLVTGGSREGLAIALLATINTGEEVLIPDPGWTNYPNYVRLAGAVPIPVPLHSENDFVWDMEELTSHITDKTAGIIVNTPTNPTGAVIDCETLLALGNLAVEHNLWIFAGESYEAILYDGAQHVSFASRSIFPM